MNILYLTMGSVTDINAGGVHTDFLRKFRDEGHNVYLASPRERRMGMPTSLKEQDGIRILGVRTLNVTKTNIVEKGLGQVSIEMLFKRAIKKYFRGVKFDIIAYATPPITFVGAIKYVKKLNPQAMTYLMLKDIFPQNAVDMGMLSKSGPKGVLYRSFRRKEKELYRISDWIGCMSPANAKYVIEHNPEVNPAKVEVCPNSCDVPKGFAHDNDDDNDNLVKIRQKYGLPTDKPVFLYGGNLGKPQGIPFLIECLESLSQPSPASTELSTGSGKGFCDRCHFLIVGDGTYYPLLGKWYEEAKPANVTVLKRLPKEDYDILARSCDVGLIFLDYRFTIPNYPSRLLSYLTQKKPIIACTDPVCDTGTIAEANGYGFWCPSNSVEAFTKAVDKMLASDIRQMGENGYRFFLENYTVQNTYDTINKHVVSTPF